MNPDRFIVCLLCKERTNPKSRTFQGSRSPLWGWDNQRTDERQHPGSCVMPATDGGTMVVYLGRDWLKTRNIPKDITDWVSH